MSDPPVGLVVVAHSRPLARAAVELAREMLHGGQVPIVVAAGLDEDTFGTDAAAIADAVATADSGAGVVVLMDLGSAVLSAELACELLDDDARDRVLLCPAPLVEGLVVAAVAAAGGADRTEVAAEASAALAGKTAQLGGPPAATAAAPGPEPGGTEAAAGAGGAVSTGPAAGTGNGAPTGSFTVGNPHGLHARPAARLVQEVRASGAQVRLRNRTTGSEWVPAASLSRVATLGAQCGHEVEIEVAGPGARDTLDRLLALAQRQFDEGPAAAAPAQTPVPPRGPVAASPGTGIGPARPLRQEMPDVPAERTDDPAGAWRDLTAALAAVREEIERVRARTAQEVGTAEAAIFDAHLLLLDDTGLLDEVRSRVDGGEAAAPAWAGGVRRVAGEFAALPDAYQQARAADVLAVGDQVLRALQGPDDRGWPRPSGVLVAGDLTPAEATELDPADVSGVVLAYSSPTAHSVILLRARGIPAVVGAGAAVLDVADGTPIALDGGTGELIVDPPDAVLRDFEARAGAFAAREQHVRARAAAPATTRDGTRVLVGANVGSLPDAVAAAGFGADLAGLVRTEFLFLGREHPPDVEEQEAAYRAIADAFGGRRITLRALDVGGDKPLAYLPVPAEANPFLGLRGIRLGLARPALLADQLLAAVRVAHDAPVSLMFPMVSTLDELLAARRMLDDAIAREGRGRPDGLQVGIMVEVPATALKTPVLTPHVDFLSIGTNDLTQYALAAERGNDAVAGLADALDPGVLALVDAVCRGAGPDTLVAVCGELAADEQAVAVLLGLGVRELSVAPPAVPRIKEAVRELDMDRARSLAGAALGLGTPAAVRELVGERRPGRAGPSGSAPDRDVDGRAEP
ncbi:phosphoenolpyruvate--protein phosphotransferase [Pseudonocardia bannensis]|uniref:phosphoenolpyruvate--protein phosphotransferase n=1 Tax=Pseudonocardia bannensis TaxID=630973 RepID=UPI0028B1BFC6|nr:phosphoenolpyruvate--protein phosphotransferase [Pseudonocardia bannensis]